MKSTKCLVCGDPIRRAGIAPFCSTQHRLTHLRSLLDAAATNYFGINPVEIEDGWQPARSETRDARV